MWADIGNLIQPAGTFCTILRENPEQKEHEEIATKQNEGRHAISQVSVRYQEIIDRQKESECHWKRDWGT